MQKKLLTPQIHYCSEALRNLQIQLKVNGNIAAVFGTRQSCRYIATELLHFTTKAALGKGFRKAIGQTVWE